MPRPNKPRSIGAEDVVRSFMLKWLEDQERSCGWLARRMAQAGCPIDQASVWRTLHRNRSLMVDELAAMSAATGVDLFAEIDRNLRGAS